MSNEHNISFPKKTLLTKGQKSSNHDDIKYSNKSDIKLDSQKKIKPSFFNQSSKLVNDDVREKKIFRIK